MVKVTAVIASAALYVNNFVLLVTNSSARKVLERPGITFDRV